MSHRLLLHCADAVNGKKDECKDVNQSVDDSLSEVNGNTNGQMQEIKASKLTFAQLENATENFNSDYFLGEGGFGKVYKGRLEHTGQVS